MASSSSGIIVLCQESVEDRMVGPESAEIESDRGSEGRRPYPNIMLHACLEFCSCPLKDHSPRQRQLLATSWSRRCRISAAVIASARNDSPVQLLHVTANWVTPRRWTRWLKWFTAIFVRSSQSRFWGLLWITKSFFLTPSARRSPWRPWRRN